MSSRSNRRVLVTGSRGFIGKNLVLRLREDPGNEILTFDRHDTREQLRMLVAQADAIVHLAGENRPKDDTDFWITNVELTEALCDELNKSARGVPMILASSIHAGRDNPYGRSKLAAERAVSQAVHETQSATIYRLPNVFGKWCRPNYNSVVATFCHNIANGLPIRIDDPAARLRLVYVDDVITEFLRAIERSGNGLQYGTVTPEYAVTLGGLAAQVEAFERCRDSLVTERVGVGLARALYATYVSYLPPERFAYDLAMHADRRGVFVEMLKTPDCGQFSFFTARPGVTRGGHYHHTKTEKFLVVKGRARFAFRHLGTDQRYDLEVEAEKARIVESIPGWSHDVTNTGTDELIVLLWANEIFDRTNPDTIPSKV